MSQDAMSPLPTSTEDPDQKLAAIVEMKKPAISKRFLRATKTRVLVLGAGMSGLACARELQQRGYRVLVVEARDRPGGRLKGGVKTNDKEGGNEGMKTLPTSIVTADNVDIVGKPNSKARIKKETSTPIDLGGALIHGIESNPIYSIVQEMGIPTKAVSECLLFSQTGWPVDTREDEKISVIFNECLEETFDRVAKPDSAIENETSESKDSGKLKATTTETTEPEPASETSNISSNPVKGAATAASPASGPIVEPASSDTHQKQSVPEPESPEGSATANEDEKGTKRPKSNRRSMGEEKKEEEKKESPVATRKSARSIARAARAALEEKQAESAAKNTPTSSRRNRSKSEYKPAATESASSESEPQPAEATPPSFGDVFKEVCKEKGAPTGDPLFEWHQANLEVSCGASFPDLGYKWNDDEAYGFSGDHVALKTSWKPVMESMAEGIDVLYQHPVKKVVMVVPDPPPKPPPPLELAPPAPTTPRASLLSPGQTPASVPAAPASLPLSKRKPKRPATPTTAPLPSRKSRRLVGDDPDARRSNRSTKGKKVDRFLVNEFSRGTYEGKAGKSPRKRPQEQEVEDIHTTVQVTLEDGTVLEAEAVVCTLPLGILKLQPKPEGNAKTGVNIEDLEESEQDAWDESSGAVTFHPPLPLRKQAAIQRLGCGLLNKCVLSFSHVFWQDSDFLGLAHPANSYLVLNAAKYTNKPILMFMYGGAFAKQIESWTDNEIVGDCMEVIRIICGRRDIPAPLDYAVTRWSQERYSRMSFSYVPPGVDGMEEFKAISEAVYDPLEPTKPVIMFAGEHTTPFHPSTMHGAFLSGIREAYRLDLVIEAEANGNLEFDDEDVYQHTFGVRRLFPAVRSPGARNPASATSGNTNRSNQQRLNSSNGQTTRRQHRRRGAASVMNLRERPATDQPTETPSTPRRRRPQVQEEQGRSRGSVGPNGVHKPANRSRRSVYSMGEETSSNGANKGLTTDQDEELQKKQIALLEGRTLMRALESYGHNYNYIQNLVLPIFGSGVPAKSVPQLRARCNQLIRSILSSASAGIPKRVLASWAPKNVYVPPSLATPGKRKKKKEATSSRAAAPRNGKSPSRGRSTSSRKPPAENSRRRSTSSAKPPVVEGTRRSSRETKQREVMNL